MKLIQCIRERAQTKEIPALEVYVIGADTQSGAVVSSHTRELDCSYIEDGTAFHPEVKVRASGQLALIFSLKPEYQYLSLGFYYSCYT